MQASTAQPRMNKFSAIDPLQPLNQHQFDKAKAAWVARVAARSQAAAERSTGPVTPEGKAISAQNARKHGFAGAKMVIDEEDKDAYDAHLDAYRESFAPVNQVESDTVRLAANAMWRVDRLTSIETGLIELEMAHNAPHIDAFLENMSIYHYLAIGFMEHTNDTTALELCRRYLASAQRDFQRAIDLFYKLKENRATPASEAAKNSTPKRAIHIIPGPPNELPQKPAAQVQLIPHTAGTRKPSRAERRKNRK